MANSIIGDSFDFYVKDQILTRQQVLGLGLNDQDIVNYKHNNSAFIRLTSGVNVDSSVVTSLGLGGEQYKGNGLAKQFKLFSARTLDTNSNEIFTKGIGYNNLSSYGFMSGPEYGYVPPPGIISAEVKAMNRGSLREANIEIQCHNLQQFQIIEILYMRLKYSILLEWGHNMYYTNPTRNEDLSTTSQPISLEQSRFDLSDDMLNKNQSQESILKNIASTRAASYGNYDAFFGLVTNFSWTLRQDGGYNITVTARSMGDVIESLKINTSYPIRKDLKTGINVPNLAIPGTANTALQTDYYKSTLNRILSTIVVKLYGNNYCHGIDQGNGAYNPINNYKLEEYTDLKAAFNRTTEAGTTTDKDQDFLTYKEALQIDFRNLSGGMFGRSQFYIKLGVLLRIIESFLIYYDTSKGKSATRPPLFKIDYNYNTNYCLTFPRHTSLDPKVCLIPISDSASSAGASGFIQIDTRYTYLTKANPGATQFGGKINTDIDFPNEAGNIFYNNQFAWREELTTEGTTTILNPPTVIPAYIFNDLSIQDLTDIYNTPQTDDTNRIEGYKLLNRLRDPIIFGRKGNITPVLGKKYITNIDFQVNGTTKDITKTFTTMDANDDNVTFDKTEKVYKASIVVTEYRDLGSNYGGGSSNVLSGEEVYKTTLKDIPFLANAGKGRMMHMLVNMEYITSILSKNINIETGELALYDFLDNLMKGIQHALGNINNFEIVYDEENNIHRIIDNTTIPGIANLSKGIAEFNANLLQAPNNGTNNKIGGSFIKNVNFKTKLSNNFATMTTIGAQKNGNVVGANATMLSRWNDGLTDRIITDRGNPNYTQTDEEAKVEDIFIKNIRALQDLNTLVNERRVGDYEVKALEGSINDLFQAELGKFVKDGDLPGIGFIPFDLELTMLGLSGPRIYEAYTIDTTLLPNSYKEKLQFICTGVSHKISDGEWTTTLNSIAGPKPNKSKIFNPPPIKVLNDTAQEANNGGNNNDTPIPTGTFLGNDNYNPIKSVVFKDESSSYDALFPSTTYTAVYGVAATTKTIQQIIDEGHIRVTTGFSGKVYSSSAVGRYQQLTRFINDRATAVGLSPTTDLYNELNQEKMGEGLIDDSCGNYIKGVNEGSKAQLEDAVQALAQQFATKPVINKTANKTGNFGDVTTGTGNTGYYGGDNAGNPKIVRINVGQVVKGLIDTRKNFVDTSITGIGGLPTFIPSYYS